jgi:hypothetical protein
MTFVSDIRLDMIPPTVQTVKFRFVQAESCFLRFPSPPSISFPHQYASDDLVDLGTFSDSESWEESDDEEALFQDFDGSMQTFASLKSSVLQTINRLPSPAPVCVNSQKYHPSDAWIGDGVFHFAKYLPNLRELSLLGSPAITPSLLNLFPSTLQHLELDSFKVNNLEEVNFERLSFSSVERDWNANLRPDLIKRLSYIQAPSIAIQTTMSHVTTLVLQYPGNWEWNLALLPPSLTRLSVMSPVKSSPNTSTDAEWPKGLTSLSLDACRWPERLPPLLKTLQFSHYDELHSVEQVQNLPRTLRHLETQMSAHALDWNAEHAKALPDLTNLRISLRDHMLPREFLAALPRSITHLNAGRFVLPSDLAFAPPNLKVLSFGTNSEGSPFIEALPPFLPPCLEELEISVRSQAPVLGASFASALPPGLLSLTIWSGRISGDFLCHLPQNLRRLTVWGQIKQQISPLTVSRLPQTLTHINLPAKVYLEESYMILLPRGLITYERILDSGLRGNLAHHLPPSMRLETSNTRATPKHDLPDKLPQS